MHKSYNILSIFNLRNDNWKLKNNIIYSKLYSCSISVPSFNSAEIPWFTFQIRRGRRTRRVLFAVCLVACLPFVESVLRRIAHTSVLVANSFQHQHLQHHYHHHLQHDHHHHHHRSRLIVFRISRRTLSFYLILTDKEAVPISFRLATSEVFNIIFSTKVPGIYANSHI